MYKYIYTVIYLSITLFLPLKNYNSCLLLEKNIFILVSFSNSYSKLHTLHARKVNAITFICILNYILIIFMILLKRKTENFVINYKNAMHAANKFSWWILSWIYNKKETGKNRKTMIKVSAIIKIFQRKIEFQLCFNIKYNNINSYYSSKVFILLIVVLFLKSI